MAVPYDQVPDEEEEAGSGREQTDFASIRDSFYILMNMNQYTMNPGVFRNQKDAERLLRIVLFSKHLPLEGKSPGGSLNKKRQNLARYLRKSRRRGVVPVFISTMWFLFSLAISIQAGEFSSSLPASRSLSARQERHLTHLYQVDTVTQKGAKFKQLLANSARTLPRMILRSDAFSVGCPSSSSVVLSIATRPRLKISRVDSTSWST